MPRDHDVPLAPDGLVARENGAWAKEKLSFIDQFGPAALAATTKKLQRYYVDLFAGPGMNWDRRNGEFFEGAALRALTMHALSDPSISFTRAVLVNKDAGDHHALEARVQALFAQGRCPMPRRHVELLNWDTNRLIHRIMRSIDPKAYIFVFADIEAPNQLPWATVQAMRGHGHTSVDLYALFPLDMAINRMISFQQSATESSANALTRFFGTDRWRAIADLRITDAQSPDLRRRLLELYQEQLRGLGWHYVKVVRDVRRTGQAGLYKMLYASSHPAGDNISGWSAAKPDGDHGQLSLGF